MGSVFQTKAWLLAGATLVAGLGVAAVVYTGQRGSEPAADAPPPQAVAPAPAPAPVPTPEPQAAPEPEAPPVAAPAFDVVRVAEDGGALVAGSALAGSAVVLRVDGTPVAETSADNAGQFVSLFALAPSDAVQVMTLEMVLADGRVIASEDRVVLAPRPEVVAAMAGAAPESVALAALQPEPSPAPVVTDAPPVEAAVAQAPGHEGASAALGQPETPVDDRAGLPVAGRDLPPVPVAEPAQTGAGAPTAGAAESDVAGETEVAEVAEDTPGAVTHDLTVADAAPEALQVIENVPSETSVTPSLPPAGDTVPRIAALSEGRPSGHEAAAPVLESGNAPLDTGNDGPVVIGAAPVPAPVTEPASPQPAAPQPVAPQPADPGREPVETPPAEVIARASEPAAPALQPVAPLPPVELADTTPTPAAPAPQPVEPPAAEAVAHAPGPAENHELAESPRLAEDPVPAENLVPRAFVLRGSGAVDVLGRAPEVMDNIVIDLISYSDLGDVQISGRAASGAAGTRVQIYLDNRPVALAVAENGDWASDLPEVDPGVYALRVDQLDDDGRVVSRFETPFQREDPARVRAAREQGEEVAAQEPERAAAPSAPEDSLRTDMASAPERHETTPPTGVTSAETTPDTGTALSGATRAETGSQTARSPVDVSASVTTALAQPVGQQSIALMTVQPGHSLWRISEGHYGAGSRYLVIYNANRSQIRNPDLIYPGQIFVLPD